MRYMVGAMLAAAGLAVWLSGCASPELRAVKELNRCIDNVREDRSLRADEKAFIVRGCIAVYYGRTGR